MHPSIKIIRGIVDSIYLNYEKISEKSYAKILDALDELEKNPNAKTVYHRTVATVETLQELSTNRTVYIDREDIKCGLTWSPIRQEWWLVFKGEVNGWQNNLPLPILKALAGAKGLEVTWT